MSTLRVNGKKGWNYCVFVIIGIAIMMATTNVYPQRQNIFRKLTNKDGLSFSTVKDICQDSTGALWIATKHGLNKYDSYVIKQYLYDEYPEMGTDFCSVLLNTSEGKLLIGTTGGLLFYNPELDTFEKIMFNKNKLPSVISLLEKSSHNVLVGTANGLFEYFPATGSIKRVKGLGHLRVTSIINIDNDMYLIGTGAGIFLIDSAGKHLKSFNTNNATTLPSNMITCLYNDATNIWVGVNRYGLFKFDIENEIFEKVELTIEKKSGVNFIRVIKADNVGNLWIGTEGGLIIYNIDTGEKTHIQHSLTNSKYALNDNSIYSLFLGRENIMWMGTYFGGVNYTRLNYETFYHIFPGESKNEIKGKAVNKIIKDSNDQIWIATEDGGVFTLNPKNKNVIEHFSPHKGNGISSNNVHSICEDRYGKIWVGHFTKGIDVYDPKKKTVDHLLPNPEEKDDAFENSVYSIFSDSRKILWVGTRVNLLTYNFKSKQFIPFKPQQISNVFIYHITEDNRGRLWFSTRHRGVYRYDPIKDELIHYYKNIGTGNGLASDQIISAMEDSNGRMWFGSSDEGVSVYLPEKDTFKVISTNNGLPDNTIYGILEDSNENIWLSSNQGLTKYNFKSEYIKNYKLEDGLEQMQFNFNSYFKDVDGTMYFGTIGGLTYFKSEQIKENQIQPYVLLSDLKLFNKSVSIGENEIIDNHINYTDSITLKYSQNVLTIDYTAVNHSTFGTNQFFYYLDGFENDWNNVGNKTSVTYTNLSPGKYTFYLKAKNNDGIESSNIKILHIRVLRPWWLSDVALLLYLLFIISIIWIIRKSALSKERARSALKLEKAEKEKIKELNKQRLNFFTYISHEFKTPLSIIIAYVDEITRNKDLNKDLNNQLTILKRSARRLSFLISQLMEFRKIETRHPELTLHKEDLITFINDTCMAFAPLFFEKNISFNYKFNVEHYKYWFDADKIEKIASNLISNAVKFTRRSIECEVIIEEKEKNKVKLIIKVTDDGLGITDENKKSIFSSFYMGAESNNRNSGTGIGLTLVKSLVDYLQGTISVESKLGLGTTFSVSLPLSLNKIPNLIIKNDHTPLIRNNVLEDYYSEHFSHEIQEVKYNGEKKNYHILIVEDTIDLAQLLIKHYNEHYQVSFAKDGKEALKIIHKEAPDLIITDIMMPDMNGIELCQNIKSNQETSHIAIILLTAKVAHEDKIKGLGAGAEAYIYKPFYFEELDLVVRNFLNIRKELFRSMLSSKDIDLKNVNINDKDKDLIEKSTQIIKDNIGNDNFSVEDLATELGLSTSLVYLKHKKLLDTSPKEYIQMIRFTKAIEYMVSSDHSISEIAYLVGFTDPNYFSKAFKKVYKKTPSQYKAQIRTLKES